MSGPLSEEYVCGECGGRVRCVGGDFRRDLDGDVLGVEEGYRCEDGEHFGTIVSANEEVHSVTGLVRR